MTGFIKIHRKITEWEWYQDLNVCRLFMHLLFTANFKQKRFMGMVVERGQLVTGRLELAKSTGLSEQQIRTALDKLKSTNEITIKTTNRFSIITLVNYSLYQDNRLEIDQVNNHQNNQQITNNQPTNNQQITTIKERKKERKKENSPLTPQTVNNSPLTNNLPSKGVLKQSFKERQRLTVDSIMTKLDETALARSKSNAPHWDIYYLANIYVSGINNGDRKPPKSIKAAFPAWCKAYTKGNEP